MGVFARRSATFAKPSMKSTFRILTFAPPSVIPAATFNPFEVVHKSGQTSTMEFVCFDLSI